MRERLRFYLGEELIELGPPDPTLGVLDWLRQERRLTGTKEGCAEGDCGACTVVVGRLDGGEIRYEAINACIRFLPTLDGCQLLTVEHLKGPDGALHPVQQAMVAHHGSQCGFCTPGIVMSLFALRLNEENPSLQRIEDALAGNLCRCTGYEPIVRAALAAGDDAGDDTTARDEERERRRIMAGRLGALRDGEDLALASGGRRYLAPASLAGLAEAVAAEPDAMLVAGATDLGLRVTKALERPQTVIHLGRVDELRRITREPDGLRFGAMANHVAVRRALATLSPQLDELMRRFGGEQIRNAGTIGGNIANGSPIGDLPPALIALGARLVLARSRRGGAHSDEAIHEPPAGRPDRDIERRILPLEDFFLDYRRQDRRQAEFVEAVLVPTPPADALIHVSKISKRFDEDISTLCGAFLIRRDGTGRVVEARLAYGGMAGIPKRARAAEAALTGRDWDEAGVAAAIAALARDFTPLSDMRASARYRSTVAGNLLRRLLIETTEPAVATRVAGPLAEPAHENADG